MDIERTLETQRLRLLRVLAGLGVVVGVLAIGPVSRGFSRSACGFVGTILSRIEMATRYMLITQACLMISRNGLDIDRRRISEFLAPVSVSDETDILLHECRVRLNTLRGILMDLPRHAMRLLRRIEKLMRRTGRASQIIPELDPAVPASRQDQHPTKTRIDRPPDKDVSGLSFMQTPPITGREALAVVRWLRALCATKYPLR